MVNTGKTEGFFFGAAAFQCKSLNLMSDSMGICELIDLPVLKSTGQDGHILVVGGASSGKSTCAAIPSLWTWGGTAFCIDIKGELYKETKVKRPKIKVFEPMNPDKTLGYNPYYVMSNLVKSKSEDIDLTQEAQAIAYALIPLPPDTKDPYWINSARDLLTGAILHFFNSGYGFTDTISKILNPDIQYKYVQNKDDEVIPIPLSMQDSLVNTIFNSETKECVFFVNSFVNLNEKTLSCIYAELCSHIRIYATDKKIIKCLSKHDNITPEHLDEGYDVYINIPEHLLRQWKNLLSLMVSQFLRHFEQRPEMSATPILFLLDEFARLGKIEEIMDALATLRSKKITVCPIIQSLAQLDLIYGKDSRRVIIDNCAYIAVLRANDAETQEYLSKLIGTKLVKKKNLSVNYILRMEKDLEDWLDFEGKTFKKSESIEDFLHENPDYSEDFDYSKKFKDYEEKMSGYSRTTSKEREYIIQPHELGTLKDVALITPDGFCRIKKVPSWSSRTKNLFRIAESGQD